MIDYTSLAHSLKRKITSFSKKLSSGLKRPEYKFISQMLYGISQSNSVHLSNIARALHERIPLDKTINRLSINLNCFNEDRIVMENYVGIIRRQINEKTIFCIDNSDLAKPKSFRMEALGEVHDGSENRIEKGYNLFEIAALTEKHKMPAPVYTRVFSNVERDFVSQEEEVMTGLRFLSSHFGRSGIRTMDRGYDANLFIKYFINRKEPFVMRIKTNRTVIHKGTACNIMELADRYKGKLKMSYRKKGQKPIQCKVSFVPISLPLAPGKELTLVIVHGFGGIPMLLISNLKSDDNRLPLVITKVYLLRWRIEEYFRFKKQQFGMEDFRVRSLNSIRALNLMVTLVIGLVSILSEYRNDRIFVRQIIECSKTTVNNISINVKPLPILHLNVAYVLTDGGLLVR